MKTIIFTLLIVALLLQTLNAQLMALPRGKNPPRIVEGPRPATSTGTIGQVGSGTGNSGTGGSGTGNSGAGGSGTGNSGAGGSGSIKKPVKINKA